MDTSSDDDDDDDGADEQEANQLAEPVASSQEDKPEVMKEEEKTAKDGQKEEKNTDQAKVQTSQKRKPSQPVVFVPVDRLPEIQVCVRVKVEKRNATNDPTLFPGHSNSCFALGYHLTCACRRLG